MGGRREVEVFDDAEGSWLCGEVLTIKEVSKKLVCSPKGVHVTVAGLREKGLP